MYKYTYEYAERGCSAVQKDKLTFRLKPLLYD